MVLGDGWWGGCKGPLGSLGEKGRGRGLLLGAAPLLLVHLLHHLLCLLHARLHPHHIALYRSKPHTFSGIMINAAFGSGREYCLALLATSRRLQGWCMQINVCQGAALQEEVVPDTRLLCLLAILVVAQTMPS